MIYTHLTDNELIKELSISEDPLLRYVASRFYSMYDKAYLEGADEGFREGYKDGYCDGSHN